MKNKIVSIAIAILFSVSIIGCGDDTTVEQNLQSETSFFVENTESEQEVYDTEIVTESKEDVIEIPKVEMETKELPQSATLDFVKDMRLGWNLGNTFDAVNCGDIGVEYETAWCGVKTTEEMITTIKEAGFHTIRIPVSWHDHLLDEQYTIDPEWMNRVNEVVDYAISQDMYVIINVHHDNDEKYMYPTSTYLEQSKQYISAVWKQIANQFASYDDKLIFEGMNEPRMVGTNNEWWIDPNNADCKDAIACINEINQVFVDTIRASDGNNKSRYLLCPGYDASFDGALNDGYVLPMDPVTENDHRIMVEVHAYTPYSFALDINGTSEWNSSNSGDLADINQVMDRLYEKYTKNGIGVVIDEFGSMNKDNLKNRVDHASYFVAKARANGITCCWWDNNAFVGDGENFGLLRRRVNSILFPEIVEAMVKNAE